MQLAFGCDLLSNSVLTIFDNIAKELVKWLFFVVICFQILF